QNRLQRFLAIGGRPRIRLADVLQQAARLFANQGMDKLKARRLHQFCSSSSIALAGVGAAASVGKLRTPCWDVSAKGFQKTPTTRTRAAIRTANAAWPPPILKAGGEPPSTSSSGLSRIMT